MRTKTYKIENKFKNYEFSKGEELTEMDLEAIASRSRTYYIDSNYSEEYLSNTEDDLIEVGLDANDSEFYGTYNNKANLIPEEQQYSKNDSFQIGNNIKGGI